MQHVPLLMHRWQDCQLFWMRSVLILLIKLHYGEHWKWGAMLLKPYKWNLTKSNKKVLEWYWINLPCTEDDAGPLKWGLIWMFLGCGGCCWWCWGKLGGGELIIRGGGSIWGRIGGERWAMCRGMRGCRGCWASGRPCSWKGGGPLGREGWCCCWDCSCCWWGWWGRGIREDGC